MKYKKVVKLFLIAFIMILFIPHPVHADMGPKPSITIYVKNYKSQSYYLDLLTKDGVIKYEDFNKHKEYSEDIKNMPFYKYNEDGWKATHIRNFLLFGNLKGEYNRDTGFMVHKFGYRGVPDTFKVIVQYDNGDIVVSNVITPKQFNAKVMLDLETGKLIKLPQVSYGFFYFLYLIALTVIIELIIAKLFKYKKYGLIIKTNIFTQLFLHFTIVPVFYLVNFKIWYLIFLLLEVLIVGIEFYIYSAYSKEYSRRKLLAYTICANAVTFVIGLLL